MIAQPPLAAPTGSRRLQCRSCGWTSTVPHLFRDGLCLACQSQAPSTPTGREATPLPAVERVARAPSNSAPAAALRSRGDTARWAAKRAGRVVLWITIGVVLLAGVRAIVAPARATVSAPASPSMPSFPMAAVEAVAARFSMAYWTYDPTQPDARASALSAFLPPSADLTVGWNTQGTEQALTAMPAGTHRLDQHRVVVTVATEVTGGRWLYLQVPLSAQGSTITVTGPPAEVPPPTPRSAPQPQTPPQDAELTSQLQPTLGAFFAAYAGTGDLAYYAPPGVHIAGLEGALNFVQLESVSVNAGSGDTRSALAMVQWKDPVTRASLVQSYRLQLVAVGGRWYVASVAVDA